ncbi:phage major capsid protein [Aggregatilineales bacterium SYSU G02658]
MNAVKLLDMPDRVGGYLVVWGSPAARDLHGDYFTPETDFGLEWFEARPMLYHHGLDDGVQASVVGRIDHLKADEVGLWAEGQLDRRHRYAEAIRRLIAKGALAWSSGSLPHLIQRAADGHIRRWILVEGSLTPTPAEPRLTDVSLITPAYRALGMNPAPLLPDEPFTQQGTPQKGTPMNNEPKTFKRLPIADAQDAQRIRVSSEFDTLSAEDLLHGYVLLRASRDFHGVSERYANALAHKVRSANLSHLKADELSTSTQAGYGDEWVQELWSAQIWKKARVDNVVMPLFRAVDMPSNPFDLPVEGADPVVTFVPETKDEAQLTLGASNPIPDSKIGSGKVVLHAKKLALRVGFSSELVEDSIVPVVALYREQAVRAIADAIDHALLNGDTTTAATGNINSDHAAPPAGSVYLAFDGVRKTALSTAGNAIDMGNAAPTLAKLREARFAMAYRYSARPNELAWIVDGGTYARLLSLPELITMDKAGALATAQTGQIGFLDGIPVLVSSLMHPTEADGKVGAGPNNRGTAVCVYRGGWFVGYRRKISVNVDYLPYYDSYQLTASVRLGFGRYDDDVASALYNIAV